MNLNVISIINKGLAMKTILYWLKYAAIPLAFWATVIICVIW